MCFFITSASSFPHWIFCKRNSAHYSVKTVKSGQIGNGSRSGLRSKVLRMRRAVRQAERLKLWENVDLLSYSLMPNHFHLLVYQRVKNGIEMVMRRLGSGYSGYYTYKYGWAGPVMQGRYNASCLFWEPELQALAAARYIERNFLDLPDYARRSNDEGNRSQHRLTYNVCRGGKGWRGSR